MAEKKAEPSAFGRRPKDGPMVSREEIDQRQAGAMNRETDNGELRDGKRMPWITPADSKTTGI